LDFFVPQPELQEIWFWNCISNKLFSRNG